MNAQGMITWDIEGQQFRHATTYIGDPRLVETLARFSVLGEEDRPAPAAPRDLDARLIQEGRSAASRHLASNLSRQLGITA